MNHKEIEHITEKTLQSWDGMKQAEVSPFLWTRISENLANMQQEQRLIAQPAMKLFLGIWLVLIVAHTTFWLSANKTYKTTVSTEVRNSFFSDDNLYISY